MLNYTEKPQNTYVQSWTVWEIMAIENCGLPSGPRTIAVNWDSYLLVGLRVTSPLNIPVWYIVLRTVSISMTRMRGTLQLQLPALCHSQVTLLKSTDINITETTYSCQFQYEFGNFKCVTAVKVSNFTGHYLPNRSTLDIGVLGFFGIV